MQETGGCGFFLWFDPPMSDRARVVILGLLHKVDRHEKEREMWKLKKKNKKKMCWKNYVLCVIVSLVFGIVYQIMCNSNVT